MSQRVLQTQISTGTKLGDHSRNLACPESSCLDLSILRASFGIAGCQSHRRRGAVRLQGQAGSRADVTTELSSRASGKPRFLKNPACTAQITFLHGPGLHSFRPSISDRPCPQYEGATPTHAHGSFMKKLNIALLEHP